MRGHNRQYGAFVSSQRYTESDTREWDGEVGEKRGREGNEGMGMEGWRRERDGGVGREG